MLFNNNNSNNNEDLLDLHHIHLPYINSGEFL